MQTVRLAQERGQADFAGLRSQHSFSFGQYYDPQHMGYGPLRVINEDRVAPGGGFPPHGHQVMEIISWVLSGSMTHQDSLGHGSVICAGELQRMTAGTGIRHSEFNTSTDEPLEFLQVWIVPNATGLAPSYEQKSFAHAPIDELTLMASQEGRDDSVTVHQDVDLYLGRLAPGGGVQHLLTPQRIAWLQVTSGSLETGGEHLSRGDGLAISHATDLMVSTIEGNREGVQFLLFDMQSH